MSCFPSFQGTQPEEYQGLQRDTITRYFLNLDFRCIFSDLHNTTILFVHNIHIFLFVMFIQ